MKRKGKRGKEENRDEKGKARGGKGGRKGKKKGKLERKEKREKQWIGVEKDWLKFQIVRGKLSLSRGLFFTFFSHLKTS